MPLDYLTVSSLRHKAVTAIAEDLLQQSIDGNVALVRPRDAVTLAAVGADFVQLREADGAERFIPLARVDVVVRPEK